MLKKIKQKFCKHTGHREFISSKMTGVDYFDLVVPLPSLDITVRCEDCGAELKFKGVPDPTFNLSISDYTRDEGGWPIYKRTGVRLPAVNNGH